MLVAAHEPMLKRLFGGEWQKAYRQGYWEGVEEGIKRSEKRAKGYSEAQRPWAESWMEGYMGLWSDKMSQTCKMPHVTFTAHRMMMQILSVALAASISTLSNPEEFLRRLRLNIKYLIQEARLPQQVIDDLRLMYESIADDFGGCKRFIRDADDVWWNEIRY